MLRKDVARKTARKIIQKSGQFAPPVDLWEIAELLNVEIIEQELDEEISGFAFCKAGVKYAVVNASHTTNRKRFTCAHEIAHHVLHEVELAGQVHVDGRRVLRRDEHSAKGKDLIEIEANNFAAELLMPATWIREHLPEDFDPEDSKLVSKLAKLFKVSEAAFYYRVLSPLDED